MYSKIRKWGGLYRAAVLSLAFIAAVSCDNNATQKAQQAPLKQVNVLLDWKAEPTYAGFYLAKELGIYKQHGLDVKIDEGSGATVSATIIAAGTDHFIGSCSGEASAIGRSKDLPIKSLAVYYREVPTVLYSRADTPIREPKDMIGKRIGLIEGSITVDEYRGLVANNQIDRTQIHEIGVGWDVAPLLTSKVDGLMNYGELTPVQLRLQGHDIVTMRFADFGVRAYSLNLIANERWLEANGAIADSIVAATNEGYRIVRDDPARAAGIFRRLFPEKDSAYVYESMKVVAQQLGTGAVGSQTRDGWEATIGTLDGLGLLQRRIAVDDVAPTHFLARQ